MKATSWWNRAAWIAVVLLVLAAAPTAAQDDAGTDDTSDDIDGLGQFVVEIDGWVTQPAGADLSMAFRQGVSDNVYSTLESIPTGTEPRLRYRFGYRFRDNIGTILFSWYATSTEEQRALFTPGVFGFSQIHTAPIFQGVLDDALSDGVRSTAILTTRDLRLTYYRDLPGGKRIDARWFVGYRRVSHNRDVETEYFALAANLPPILPPVGSPQPDLEPATDRALGRTEHSVRGAEAGLEVMLPIWKDRFRAEAGIAVAAMRGRSSSQYESTTHFYVLDDSGNRTYIDPRDPVWNEPGFTDLDFVQQEDVNILLQSVNESTSSMAVETHLGFRWRAWREFEVVGGFRQSYYDNVSELLVPSSVTANDNLDDFGVGGVERQSRSLTLEGYYLGISWAY